MSYQTLETIADLYTPLLALFLLLMLFFTKWRSVDNPREGGLLPKAYSFLNIFGFTFLQLLFYVFLAYLLMFLDKVTGLWPSLGLDYSTHSAVALALVYLSARISRSVLVLCLVSFMCYALLMMYQRYHTALDIFSTSFVFVFSCFLVDTFLVDSFLGKKKCA